METEKKDQETPVWLPFGYFPGNVAELLQKRLEKEAEEEAARAGDKSPEGGE